MARLRLSPHGMFTSLAQECDNNHVHRPWGGASATSSPQHLKRSTRTPCAQQWRRLSSTIAAFPWQPHPGSTFRGRLASRVRLQDRRVAAGVQPRGDRAPHILPEFERMLQIDAECGPSESRAAPGYKWKEQTVSSTLVPTGAVTVRTTWPGDTGRVDGRAVPNEGTTTRKTKERLPR